ncbi:hypothetical protein L1887_47925 [Cichorium endivia]|nr:hypothetical protein L1887_47925 [Cichorium endivia]
MSVYIRNSWTGHQQVPSRLAQSVERQTLIQGFPSFAWYLNTVSRLNFALHLCAWRRVGQLRPPQCRIDAPFACRASERPLEERTESFRLEPASTSDQDVDSALLRRRTSAAATDATRRVTSSVSTGYLISLPLGSLGRRR